MLTKWSIILSLAPSTSILSRDDGIKGRYYEQENSDGILNKAKKLFKKLVPKTEEIDLPSLQNHYELFQKTYGNEDAGMPGGFTGILGKYLKPKVNFMELK